MAATPAAYRPPYISQKRRDTDGRYTDCAAESSFMLAACWTLGEWIRRPDGSMRDLYDLSAVLRKRIGDTTDGLTLHDCNDLLHELDPELPDLPRYPGQKAKDGQSTKGADLRLTWEQLVDRLKHGHCAIVLGYLGTVGHAIFVYRGKAQTVTVLDPFTFNGFDWEGDEWSWKRLRDFTEKSIDGDRFGSPSAIACAVVKIGDQAEAARVADDMELMLDKARARIVGLNGQLDLATDERDEAKRDLSTAAATITAQGQRIEALEARVAELEAIPVPDCAAQLAAQRKAIVAAVSSGVDSLLAGIENQA